MTTKKPSIKKKGNIFKESKNPQICTNCKYPLFNHGTGYTCPPFFKVTKTTGLPKSRFAEKEFSRFAPEDTYTTTENYKKHTNFLGEIEGEPAINCDKWTAMCVVLVLLCVVAYAMHGDYQALQSNLIH